MELSVNPCNLRGLTTVVQAAAAGAAVSLARTSKGDIRLHDGHGCGQGKAQAKRTRRSFMERYCDTDTLVCTAHFPLPSAGRIVAEGDAFRFEFDDADW